MSKYFVQVVREVVYEKYVEADSREDACSRAYDDISENDFDNWDIAEENLALYDSMYPVE